MAYSTLELCNLSQLTAEAADAMKPNLALRKLSIMAQGLSGRALRKLPFLACTLLKGQVRNVGARRYLAALHSAIQAEKSARTDLNT